MSKISLFIALICLFVAVQAQNDREICRNVNRRCESRIDTNGRSNDVSDIYNNQCRRFDRNWSNISRCQLAWATCQLTIERCDTLSCANVRRVLDRRPIE
ncbi:uncharacterized protein LOC108096186 [Drosophila ficusphila]|uniref:uncharacterized protein LOC108096186 n=1 Tax=Drosophila ficusphila TaxID=30025 RepID=UPI0007E5C8C3|nr:uncharacterized protein LOC108096186 [Drosophila ficusphila]